MFQHLRNRLLVLIVFALVVDGAFIAFPWPLVVLGIAVFNAIAAVGFWLGGKQRSVELTGATTALLIAALFFTDWGFSTPNPIVRVAWPWLIAACAMEIAAISWWLLGKGLNGRQIAKTVDAKTEQP